MRLAPLMVLLVLSSLSDASLLEMSQMLWAKLVGGGYEKIGRVDPLRVPVIKVDQSEGDLSYRVILRNLVISGLNESSIESVHMQRGKLRSNLSDGEAGYVSYNEQRDLDAVRYRFHTLIKEPKPKGDEYEGSASEQREKILEYDPAYRRARDEEDLLRMSGQDSQRRFYGSVEETQSGRRFDAGNYRSQFGDMSVAMKPTPRSQQSVRVRYNHSYRSGSEDDGDDSQQNVRPCVGACKPGHDSTGSVDSQYLPPHQQQQQQQEHRRAQTRVYRPGRIGGEESQVGEQRPDQFSVKSSSGYRSGSQSFRGQTYPIRGQTSEVQGSASSSYETKTQYRGSNFNVRAGGRPAAFYPGRLRNEDEAAAEEDQSGGEGYTVEKDSETSDFSSSQHAKQPQPPTQSTPKPPSQWDLPPAQSWNYGQMCEDEHHEQHAHQQGQQKVPQEPMDAHTQARFLAARRNQYAEKSSASNIREYEVQRPPLTRVEKQPGYVDVVYSRDTKQGTRVRSGSYQDAAADPRVDNLEEIVKELRANQRYIIHNFTEGESINRRNNAARTAAESRRIKDLLRYAKDHQEKQGYYEEGMELIYHFGNETSGKASGNETLLSRRKRQHAIDKEEEDVMHVIVRIRVPMLGIKSNYALMGKVGKQLLRGNGLLAGNFTDVVADFTVEMRKVDNKTMVVRAARAKLVSKDRKVRLQGMDETGPIQSVLSHGLMAAEAVAAMIADDLATKALNEGNADGMIYKMYKSLPIIEKE